MMKAQLRERDGEVVLQVCGRLAEDWVAELEKIWTESRTRLVDLRGLSFVDSSGRRLLERMHRDGATFLASGLLIQEVIAQVTSSK